MKIFISLLFSLFNLHLSAQDQAILDNPDVVWAAELEYTFDLTEIEILENNRIDELQTKLINPRISTLKHFDQSHPRQLELSFSQLQLKRDMMLEAIQGFDLDRFYEDAYLKKKYPVLELKKALQSLKAIRFSEEKDRLPKEELDQKSYLENFEFSSFRIRQFFYYNRQTQEIGAQLLALAPVVKTKNNEEEEEKTLFWIEPGQWETKDLDFHRPNVNEVKILRFDVSLDQLKVLKTKEITINERLLQDAMENELAIYTTDLTSSLTLDEINRLRLEVDTVTTFDPITYEPRRQLIRREIGGAQLPYLRFIQYFYFDQKNEAMAFHLLSVKPLRKIEFDEGDFFFRPFFTVPGRPKK